MALELTTDGDTGTSTTGATVLDMLGDHTETVLGSCFGWYLAFTRIVTGVDIVVKAGRSIDITLGTKIEIQAAGVATIQAAAVVTVQTGSVSTIGGLEELNAKTNVTDTITEHSKVITTGTYNIASLKESGEFRSNQYDDEESTGTISTEAWSMIKTINAETYRLQCDDSASFGVVATCMALNPTTATIIAQLIELA